MTPNAAEGSQQDVVRTESLVKRYGSTTVVDNVSLELRMGEVVGLLGPNGAGKTTTFKMMVGFERPTSGRVLLGGRNITGLPIHRRALLGISYLPQEHSIFRKMTVRDNLKAVLQMRGYSRTQIRERIDELEEQLGIGYLRRRIADRLSGGEKRRVEIARALTTRPKFVFLDEPFAGIDPRMIEDIQGIVVSLREQGIGVLITDHNVLETLHITDRSYMLIKGVVTASGTVEEITANEEIRDKYITDRIVENLAHARAKGAATPAPTREQGADRP